MMPLDRRSFIGTASLGLGSMIAHGESSSTQPLPSWNQGETKKALLDFISRTTKSGGSDFVPHSDRIAVFDNDGTLWCEQPAYVQLAFALDRFKTLAPKHPEWREVPILAALIDGDTKTFLAGGEHALLELVMRTHTGITTDEFTEIVSQWISKARHPKFQKLHTELVYQPMLEVLSYLRANSYKTYIVSGGGIEFMRPWAEKIYGIPPEQIVGSSIVTKYEERDGKPVLVRLPKIDFIDDKEGKPVGIAKFIGRRPVMCFGNSDGDYEMLRYTTAGTGPRLGLIVHHTDAAREYAYDRQSPVGKLAKALDDAPKRGWLIADMKRDWKTVFPG